MATTHVTTGVRQATWLGMSLFFAILATMEVARERYGWLLVLLPALATLVWARPRTGEVRVTATHLKWTRFGLRTSMSEVPLEQLVQFLPRPEVYSALYALDLASSKRVLGTVHLAERDATELVRRVALRRMALRVEASDAVELVEVFDLERALGVVRIGERWEPFRTATELRTRLAPSAEGGPFRAAAARGVVAMRASDSAVLGAQGLTGFEIVTLPEGA